MEESAPSSSALEVVGVFHKGDRLTLLHDGSEIGIVLVNPPAIKSIDYMDEGDKVRISTFWPSPSGEEDRRYTVLRSKSDGPLPKLLEEEMAKTRGFIRAECGYPPEKTATSHLSKIKTFLCEKEDEEGCEQFRIEATWDGPDGEERTFNEVINRSNVAWTMERVVEATLTRIETYILVDQIFQD